MKHRIRYYLKSTFVRYTLSYILILMILITCIVAYMYIHFHKTIYESTQDAQTNKLASVRYQSENHIQLMMGIAEQLGLSVASGNPGEENANEIMAALAPYGLYYDFCDQLYVHFYGDEWVYGADVRVKKETFFSETVAYETTSEKDVLERIEKKGETSVIESQLVVNNLVSAEERNMLTYILPLGIDKANASGCAVFFIPEERYKRFMEDEIADGGNRYILFNGEIVASGETFSLDDAYVKQAANGAAQTEIYEKLVAGRMYLFIAMPGDIEGFSFFTAIPLTSISKTVASGWSGFVVILLAFTLPCLGFMILISRSNYRMIRDMSAQFATDEDAYADNIDVIREGIHTLVGKNRDLDTELEKSLPARRNQFVNQLVKGRFENKEAATEKAKEVGLDIEKAFFEILLLGLPKDNVGVSAETILAAAPEGVSCAGTDLLGYDQLLIAAFSDDDESLKKFALDISRLPDIVSFRIPVAVSGIHEDFGDMPAACLEATSAYDGRFVAGEMRLLSFSEVGSSTQSLIPQARNYIEAIKQAMSFGNSVDMNQKLDELLMFLRNANLSMVAFRQIYNEVIAAIISIAGSSDQEAIKYYDLFTLSNCRSIDELDGILRKVCAGIMENSREKDHQPLIQNILQYMAKMYTDPGFTLSQVAEEFSLTTTRLSIEFKENMRMTPSDYLTMLRMEHSKKLLKETDKSIKDICTEVGYSDVSSYIRRFKQYTTQTPLQFRQTIRSAEEKQKDG